MASTRPIAPTEEVDMDKAVAAIMDAKDHEAVTEALATAEEALIKDLKEVDSKIELNINIKSTISATRQDASRIRIPLKSTNRHI